MVARAEIDAALHLGACKTKSSSGKAWTDDEVKQLRELAAGNTPVGVMSIKLNRTEDAIRSKAHAEGIDTGQHRKRVLTPSRRRTDRRTVT